MTKNFNTLVESVLSRLDEAPISHENPEEIVSKAVQTAKASGKGHWTPVAKMGDETAMANFIRNVVHRVLPEKDHTYNPYINTKEELKSEVLKAIEAEMKKSGWAQKFLADRLTNKELLGSVTFEVASNAVDNEAPVTQKEINAALKKKEEEMHTTEYQKNKFSKEKAPKAASEGYSKNRSYVLNDVAAGTLKGEYVDYYNALEHAGAKEELDGRSLEDALKNAGATVSRIPSILSNFVAKGILTGTEENNETEKDYNEEEPDEVETLNPEDFGELGGENSEYEDWGV